jgi:hypothetical protein
VTARVADGETGADAEAIGRLVGEPGGWDGADGAQAADAKMRTIPDSVARARGGVRPRRLTRP